VAAVLAVITSIFSRQVADELKAWTPWLVRWFVERSVLRLPAELRDRYKEEWSSHVQEIPGEVGKLLVAAGFLRAASGIQRDCCPAPDLTHPLPVNMFALLPEDEGRWGSFGVSLASNIAIAVLVVLLGGAVHAGGKQQRLGGANRDSLSTLAKRRMQ
jgi:hypothetical protein